MDAGFTAFHVAVKFLVSSSSPGWSSRLGTGESRLDTFRSFSASRRIEPFVLRRAFEFLRKAKSLAGKQGGLQSTPRPALCPQSSSFCEWDRQETALHTWSCWSAWRIWNLRSWRCWRSVSGFGALRWMLKLEATHVLNPRENESFRMELRSETLSSKDSYGPTNNCKWTHIVPIASWLFRGCLE